MGDWLRRSRRKGMIMKFCNVCGCEIATRDGENTCRSCEDAGAKKKAKAKRARLEREAALLSCGLVKVRGAMGGIYWE
jgi:hypothetical protein